MPLRLPRRCTWRQEDSRCKDMGVEISAAPGRWLPSEGGRSSATLIWEERAGAEREEQREEEHEQVPSSTAPAEVTPETIRAQSYAGLHWLGGQIVRKRDRSCLPAHVKLQDAAPTRWQC
ncbi:unnamed protein product [Prorocentrum cordatum]|uniref:Uncharacterized protein n=1 Tax=Prorocentrum cordatum TaxID=2364126 RepID=A0ABN9SBL7_9DINO|nr:unnamed protein product [Polarella glacialis]